MTTRDYQFSWICYPLNKVLGFQSVIWGLENKFDLWEGKKTTTVFYFLRWKITEILNEAKEFWLTLDISSLSFSGWWPHLAHPSYRSIGSDHWSLRERLKYLSQLETYHSYSSAHSPAEKSSTQTSYKRNRNIEYSTTIIVFSVHWVGIFWPEFAYFGVYSVSGIMSRNTASFYYQNYYVKHLALFNLWALCD